MANRGVRANAFDQTNALRTDAPDGRWIGEVPELPGVLAYGATEAEARSKAAVLAFCVIADRLEHGEPVPNEVRDFFAMA